MNRVRIVLLTFLIVFSATCLALFFLPRDWEVRGPVVHSPAGGTFIPIVSITIVRNYNVLHGVAFVLAIISVILARVSSKGKKLPFRLGLWLVPLCLYPLTCVRFVGSNLFPWTYRGTVKDTTGNEYWLLNRHFLQGDGLAIGRLKARTLFLDKFEVLADASGGFTGTYLYVVRPADAPDGYHQLHLTANNWLVGLAGKNRMHLAYDLNLSKPYAWGDVMSLSPFILIGDETRLKQTDCNHMLALGISNATNAPSIGLKWGQPRESVIKEALDSRNPEVRELAAKLLAGKK